VRVQRSWVKGWYYNPMRPGDDYYVLWKAEE
jgi:peptide/nickel transport system substrate-binding protein